MRLLPSRSPLLRPVLCVVVLVLVVATLGPAATAKPHDSAATKPWTPPEPRYDVEQIVNYPLHMSDGTQLMGSVYYPVDRKAGRRATGPFPVLVTMTPYGMWDGNSQTPKNGADDRILDYFASHGYIGLEVDTRGAGRSEGSFTPWSPQERRDHVEVIDFAAHRLDGSNGVVGLAGMSYRGLNQLLVGGMLKPGSPVKAMAPHSAGATIYDDPFFSGGIPTAFWYVYGGVEAIQEAPPVDQTAAPGGADPAHMARLARDRTTTGLYLSELYTNTATGGYMAYRDSWWDQREPIHAAQAIVRAGIPALLTSSGVDPFGRGSFRMYAALQNAAQGRPVDAPMDPSRKPDPRYQMVWSNHYNDGEWEKFVGYSLQWYDHWLKGIDNGIGNPDNTLHLGVWGGKGGWVESPNSAYPITDEYTPYYFAPEGALTTKSPKAATTETLQWAPNQSLTFTTEALADGALLAGPVTATVYATSTAPQVQLVATLNDVAPDGTATAVHNGVVADGALIGSARKLDTHKSWYDNEGRLISAQHPYRLAAEEPVPVGEVVRYDIELHPRVFDVEPGHQLQLVLSSQSPILFPTTTQLQGLRGGSYEIHLGGRHASYVNLPVLNRGALTPTGDPEKVGLAE